MLRGFTVRLYPNNAQKVLLDKQFGCARFVYNEMIRINQKKYQRTGKGLSGYDMQKYLPKIRKQYPWLSDGNGQSLQIVCHNLARAYERFFKKKTKFPAFKKRTHRQSFTAINNCYVVGKHLRLPKLNKIRFRGGDMPEGNLRRVTVKKIAGKYYSSLLIDIAEKEKTEQPCTTITGIDLGLIDMVVTSNGESFKAHKFAKKNHSRLRTAQKRLARAGKGSKRRIKARLAVARIHSKIANQRKDANHKISRILVDDCENQAFATESLNIKGMKRNRCMSAAISDSGWSQFLIFLKYKAAAAGKPVFKVGRFYPSSKTCSMCGLVREKISLSERVWTCECGAVHQRDINAAKNIALEAARNAVRGDGIRPRIDLATVSEAKIWA